MKKIIALISALIIAFAMSMVVANTAQGAAASCTPHAAYTTTVHHDAVTHVDHTGGTPAVTRDEDTWYSYNPAVDDDENVHTGYPVGDKDADKTNGWQVNSGNHTGQYSDPNFKTGEPWQEGSGNGSWFFVGRTVIVVTPEVLPKDTVVIDKAASVDVITHEAVTCKDEAKKPVVKHNLTFEPAPVPTVKPKHVVTPTVVEAGF